jgi:hypothetical protein
LDDETRPYRILASAAKYRANIARFDNSKLEIMFGSEANPPQEEVLFAGGIQIYKQGKISGTDLVGLDLIRAGEIWVGAKPTDIVLCDAGLHHIVFGEVTSTEEKVGRIDAIIRGYKLQEEAQRKSEMAARHVSFESGRSHGEWRPRYRGGGPC